MSLMYKFIVDMWKQGRVDEAYVLYQLEKKRITQEEADIILAMPQNPITQP